MMGELTRWLTWLWGQWQVQFLLAHIALNVVVAVAATLHSGEFLLGKLGEFLYRKMLPYLAVYAAFSFLGQAAGQGALAMTAFLALESMLVADLFDNLKRLGLPIPDLLTKPLLPPAGGQKVAR